MQSSGIPSSRISIPFANSGTKNAIPNASQIGVTPGAASYTDGFPPLTFTPIAAGGVPPFGADFNGILNALSAWVLWFIASGTAAPYNGTYSTAIGGYPKGALLPKATLDGFWLNGVENNTTNPDTGGAGWTDAIGGRLIKETVITAPGTFTAQSNTKLIRVRGCGGGGAGGSTPANSGTVCSVGSGGGSGAFFEAWYTSGFSSVAVTIGVAGAPLAGTGGGAGGTTSFGSLATAPGGGGGQTVATPISTAFNSAGQGGAAITASITGAVTGWVSGGSPGNSGYCATGNITSGQGAGGPFGGGSNNTSGGTGGNATGHGTGGAGASGAASASANLGGNATGGMIIVEEYA